MSLMSVKREPEWLRESRLETKRDDFEKLNAAFNTVADNFSKSYLGLNNNPKSR